MSTETAKDADRFTEELRATAGEEWEKIVHHKFTNEIAAGTIDNDVLKRYLIQDFRFLDAFVQLLCSIIAKARSLGDRIPLCQFAAVITSKEATYFQRCFDKLGVSDEERDNTPDADCTIGFTNLMANTAHNGTLIEMLAVITVCEWSYMSWGNRVLGGTVRERFECFEWVDLHTGENFESIVNHLRYMLDKEGAAENADSDAKKAATKKFMEAVQLEQDFFNFAYNA
uniref:Thiaminase-2/PQQC domain-containing protein n=1 Tax=Craspedostauros australis TaxID=1486917 RepID=A0A7R9ZLZ4_9STRA|mmetsp:Transcript_19838/g.55185  ORF Transcript_19838/g.55185 Transcript_19838/m.55185 type:complete len:228 (+) Transcript_19838:193-876(+)